ncbi:MAG: hypothetical protein HY921_06970 [Elusimicrobia bacterium]|nr:hypothetical protein [Elusimicrobiota bacterium]
MNARDCRAWREDLWSCWPQAGAVAESFLRHAQACPSCRGELDKFKAFCAAGAPSLDGLLPENRFARLAARTRAAARGGRAKAPRWAPALALAAAAFFFWSLSSVKTRANLPPAEVLENPEFFECLDVLENWEAPKP